MGITLMVKMTFVLANEFKCSYHAVSPQTCRLESPTCMVIVTCTLVPAWSLQEGQYDLFTYSFQPSHWFFIITFLFVHLLIFHFLCICKHSLLSFIILWAHFTSQQLHTAVDFILFLALLYRNRFVATHTSICSSYVSTQPPPLRYQELVCLFRRSPEVLW